MGAAVTAMAVVMAHETRALPSDRGIAGDTWALVTEVTEDEWQRCQLSVLPDTMGGDSSDTHSSTTHTKLHHTPHYNTHPATNVTIEDNHHSCVTTDY